MIFKISPYSKKLSKAITQSSKYYFFDIGRVKTNQLENLVALHLLKHCQFLEDSEGENMDLHFIRDQENREIDFCILKIYKVETLIEVKESAFKLSNSLKYFTQKLNPEHSVQIVLNLKQELQLDKIKILNLDSFLRKLSA